MPASYAHYHFAKEALSLVKPNIKTLIDQNRSAYDLGCHGPDILFYNEPYHKNKVNRTGFALHDQTATTFLKNARQVYANTREKDDSAYLLSYLLGFVTHYLLDYNEHSYVEAKIKHSHISHTEIEMEFDRYLMELDEKDPLSYDTAAHLKITKDSAKVLGQLYKLEGKDIYKSVKQMIFYLRLLRVPNKLKRKALIKAMKTLAPDKPYDKQIISLTPNALCADSNLRMFKYMQKALPLYAQLSENLIAYLNGQSDLDPYFDHTFEYQDNYLDIPVLDIDKEKEYEI